MGYAPQLGQLPQGIEAVNAVRVFQVSHSLHLPKREITICFGAAGDQTVMLVRMSLPARNDRDSTTEWEKAVWFNPQELPSEGIIIDTCIRYLNSAMTIIYNDVLTKGRPV